MTAEQNVHRLSFEDKEIILIGTAHVSKESAQQVEEMIELEKPDTVCVELCRSRYDSLTQKTRWQETDLLKAIKEKKAFVLLSNLMLASFQRRLGKKLGLQPGEEILRAIHGAEKTGAAIHLADRDIRTTLSRTWRLMKLWTKVKLFSQLIGSLWEIEDITSEQIEEMKKKDVLDNLLSEIGATLPEVRRILIDERDQYLAFKIRTAPGKKIVAAVGAGHVPGIHAYWCEPVDIESLDQMPPKGRLFGVLKWLIPAGIIGLLVGGFLFYGTGVGADMLTWWALANAFLAALGAAAALAHPLTILAAGAAAPLTSLNPMMAAGWVAGLVEAFLSKPKVGDFENLLDDITSVKGFWHNKITRILMVVVFTNLGSSIGTFVAIPLMVKVVA
ncbi:MAG: TraB/GumN family protein [Deltaproteobacteria bacterium]|nr:TraB/GumN family protein [Deltaproteobacteria bacterium]